MLRISRVANDIRDKKNIRTDAFAPVEERMSPEVGYNDDVREEDLNDSISAEMGVSGLNLTRKAQDNAPQICHWQSLVPVMLLCDSVCINVNSSITSQYY